VSKNHLEFDRSRLIIEPLDQREHLLHISCVMPLESSPTVKDELRIVSERIKTAKKKGAAVVLMMGGHVIRSGAQRYLIDLLENGYISCVAGNGAVVIHDFEFSLIGATTESVAKYIGDGRFGLWRETGRINDIVKWAADKGLGLGEAVGRVIEEENFPHKDVSVLAAAYRCGIPFTAHVGIGYDIVHEHPNCDGAAYGQTSYTDFLRFAAVLEKLEGGVLMNFGSAVMAPEVYLKALAMARNVARQEGRTIDHFTTLVCDLVQLPSEYHQEAKRDTSGYYFRPWKTMLVRTVSNGGDSFYLQGEHARLIPQLWTAVASEHREGSV
jgi:hypothetical protein